MLLTQTNDLNLPKIKYNLQGFDFYEYYYDADLKLYTNEIWKYKI